MLYRTDYLKELEYPGELKRGMVSDGAKKLQEWICLHKYHTPGWNTIIAVDGDFGPATEMAVKKFQDYYDIPVTGVVDEITWEALVSPMAIAFDEEPFNPSVNLQDRIVHIAKRIIEEHPTELHPNRGPWVRAFMKGLDSGFNLTGKGDDWAQWCNGFVSTILDHAFNSLDLNMQDYFPWTWSCWASVKNGKTLPKAKLYTWDELKAGNFAMVEKGDIFIVMKSNTEPQHIGLVLNVKGSVIESGEGNTNDEGSAAGYEACCNYRDLSKRNYCLIKLTL